MYFEFEQTDYSCYVITRNDSHEVIWLLARCSNPSFSECVESLIRKFQQVRMITSVIRQIFTESFHNRVNIAMEICAFCYGILRPYFP